MVSSKNYTPRQLAFAGALILALPAGIMAFAFTRQLAACFIVFLSMLLLGWIIFYNLLQHFINRQIKLIYKLIAQTKATKREEFYYKNILPEKSIDEVRSDVELWSEQHLREMEVLQQNETYRKEFLQNLSHELKTPIFAVQGYVDTLMNGAINNSEVNMKFLENTSRNIERLTSLIEDLDEISKLESGQLKLNTETFVIQDLVKEVFESLTFQRSEKNTTCYIKKGCESPLQVSADKEKIRQVLVNIIDNAIKYGKEEGHVEASFYKVERSLVLIEISDDGSGISEEHRTRIFERFYRTDSARSRKAGGSGLGLAICKHIIEAHQQKIHVRSSIDVGTTFGFSLPVGK
jgi:two-component system phosphate regulon sensor histidine kinase PhoR